MKGRMNTESGEVGKKGGWEEKRSSTQATFASSLHLSLASAAQRAALATCCHLALPCKQPHCHFLLTSTLFGPICISQTILPYSITVASSIPAFFFFSYFSCCPIHYFKRPQTSASSQHSFPEINKQRKKQDMLQNFYQFSFRLRL